MSRWILIGGAGLTGLKIAEDLIDRNSPNSKIIIEFPHPLFPPLNTQGESIQ